MSPKKKWTLRRHGMELRKHFPTDKPVKIRRVAAERLSGCDGEVEEFEKYYIVTINRDKPLGTQKETLWHEWAHIIAGWSEKHHHTKKWGGVYAEIYRHMQDEI